MFGTCGLPSGKRLQNNYRQIHHMLLMGNAISTALWPFSCAIHWLGGNDLERLVYSCSPYILPRVSLPSTCSSLDLGSSSSQLTNSYFWKGLKPPTSVDLPWFNKHSMDFSNSNGGKMQYIGDLIIHLNPIFHYKPSILGVPHLWKPPYWRSGRDSFWFFECSLKSLLIGETSLMWSAAFRSYAEVDWKLQSLRWGWNLAAQRRWSMFWVTFYTFFLI